MSKFATDLPIISAILTVVLLLQTGVTHWSWGDSQAASGPPPPAPLRHIRELPPETDRHLTILADQDRGPVWLLTGFLDTLCNGEGDKVVPDHLIRRVKPQYWRSAFFCEYSPGWRKAFIHIIDDLSIPFCDVLYAEWWSKQWGARPWEQLDTYYEVVYNLVANAKREGHNIRYWENWNEPDVKQFWPGTRQQFFQTSKVAHDAIRAADPQAWVGGSAWSNFPFPYLAGYNQLKPFGEDTDGFVSFVDFLRYCQQHDVQLDFLVWHENYNKGQARPELIPEHAAAARQLVEEQFADLGIKEYHINEWGTVDVGPGTQVAFFYYLDLAGIDRAGKAYWGDWYLGGILLPDATTPRTAYWAWVAYAQGTGVRLVTRTDDKRVVALASRDEQDNVRVLIGRARNPAGPQPPVKAKVIFRGLPFKGPTAEVTILHLPSEDRPFPEEELDEHTYTEEVSVVGRSASLILPSVEEDEVYAITLRPSD